ncbi:hypothetical protein DL95DRAFT_385295 [Leptodontidium sp. 2 PMI_412]|nr:hypothetical protein DL95DRAFT_385295 [Leptodontidium sp. 2 PMI_412]
MPGPPPEFREGFLLGFSSSLCSALPLLCTAMRWSGLFCSALHCRYGRRSPALAHLHRHLHDVKSRCGSLGQWISRQAHADYCVLCLGS